MSRNTSSPPQVRAATRRNSPAPLRVYRVASGMTQRDLASAAGVSPETVSNAERGVYNPHPLTARALAAVLGCRADELLSR